MWLLPSNQDLSFYTNVPMGVFMTQETNTKNNSQTYQNFANQQQNLQNFFQTIQESMANLNKTIASVSENATSVFECGNIINKANSNLNNQMNEYMNNVYNKTVSLVGDSFNCYSPQELISLQEKWYNLCTDTGVNNILGVSDIMVNCANDLAKPLNEAANKNMDVLSKATAKAK